MDFAENLLSTRKGTLLIGGAAAILAASGFDTSGMRQSVGTLQKDVRIVLDVARGRHASEPASIVELAQRTLRTLAPNA